MGFTEETAPVIRTPDQRLRVFISSTLEELSRERGALRDAVEGLHLTPVMFELGASPHPPRALYRAYLEQSHVFVGVYWQRYGWVAPDMEVSGLEDEYLLSEGMPRLIYFKDPAEREERMAEFVGRIKSGDSSFRKFSSTDELTELIREDLAHLLTERFEAVGASRGNGHGARTGPGMATALPSPVTRLLGRERAVSDLLELLAWEDVRLVTLTGVGGIGKSRLALEVARRVSAADGQRVFFVDLSPVTYPGAFPKALAAAIGVSDDGPRPLIEDIVERLSEAGPTLLVLDNFEQIVEGGRYVVDLLAGCPELKVMVASRIVLDIRGEHHWEVEPLHTPQAKCRVDNLAACSAIQLFVERAQAADPRFSLDDGNAEQLGELCRRLEGLPLAIELTAAYTRFLPPQSLLDRFDDRLDLEGHADHPERQRTLRATIDWSYGLLEDAERELFARLGVFRGGWDLKAAQAICGPGCKAEVLQTLSSLVDKSLVSIDSSDQGEPRFRMLETVRVYAAERLEESGELAEMTLRHAEYFAELCTEVGSQLEKHEMWFPLLDADRGNLLVLAERALEDERLVDPLIRLWTNVWIYAWTRGLLGECVRVLKGVAPVVGSLPAETRTGHAFLMSAGLFLSGDQDGAQSWSRKALALATETGNDRLRGLALTIIGSSTPYETARDEADAALTEAVEILRGIDSAVGIDLTLEQLGVLRLRDGRVEEAIALHREALEMGRSLRAHGIIASALAVLALDHLVKGEADTAWGFLVECADHCRELEGVGNREMTASCLDGLAGIAVARGDTELAAQLTGGAQAIREVISTPVWALLAPLAEAFVDGLRSRLGDSGFEAAAAAGAAMSWEELLTLGIERTAAPAA